MKCQWDTDGKPSLEIAGAKDGECCGRKTNSCGPSSCAGHGSKLNIRFLISDLWAESSWLTLQIAC